MVAYDYLLVELSFGAAFLCNLNHFIHALARFFLCIGVVCVNIIHLRTKRRTVCNYQNLLGFHREDLLFDVIICTFCLLTKQDTKCPLALDKENQTCLIGRKPSQMSKLDLLQSVMIFPFVTMKLKGRDRKYTTFDQIAL